MAVPGHIQVNHFNNHNTQESTSSERKKKNVQRKATPWFYYPEYNAFDLNVGTYRLGIIIVYS